MDSNKRPQVVIAGAGFGGLQATKVLAKVEVDVSLVDAFNHHCFQPLLYQVATAALSPADIAEPIRKVLRRCDGNISQASEALGLSRAALYRRIEKYGL